MYLVLQNVDNKTAKLEISIHTYIVETFFYGKLSRHWDRFLFSHLTLSAKKSPSARKTYKSLLSKHCSQKSALLGARTRSAEVDMVLGSPPVAPMPALKAGELIPPPHLFRPPADPMNSIKPPLESDMVLHVVRTAPHSGRSV